MFRYPLSVLSTSTSTSKSSLQPKLSTLTQCWKDIRAVALRWKDDNNTSFQSRRYLHLTTSTALDLLRLPKTDFHHGHGSGAAAGGGTGPPISYKQLRDAYFQAAKRCHPDVHNKGGTNNSNNTDTTTPREAAQMFLDVTEAYEFLLASTTNATSAAEQEEEGGDAFTIPKEEEMEYREACELWLGISAEVVEETKKCPLFRQWLLGNTDSAIKWNMFLCLNGGLAPRLRIKSMLLIGDNNEEYSSKAHPKNMDENGTDGLDDYGDGKIIKRRRRRRPNFRI